MAYKNADWIKETTATTGIGPLTLAGAAGLDSGTFGSALDIGDTCSYAVISSTGVERETGIGTRTASNILARTIVKSSTNGGLLVDFGVGIKTVHLGPIAGTQIPYDPVTGALNLSVNALNDVAITNPLTVNQVLKYSGTEWTNQTDAVNVGTVTSVSGAGTVSGLTLTGTVTSSGSLTLGGAISTLNQNTTGNAATVTTNANLTGHVTSVGNAAVLGSFTSAQLAGALSDETGTGAAVFANSPTLVTPLSNSLSAIPVTSGLTASVTAASSSGGILTYTAINTFTAGRTVSVTGLITASGTTLNIAGMTIATASATQFTVVNATVGVSSGTGTATAGGNTLADAASNAVTAGPGGNRVIKAGDGVGVGKGGDIILQLGAQGSSGGNGGISIFHPSGVLSNRFTTNNVDPNLYMTGHFNVGSFHSNNYVNASSFETFFVRINNASYNAPTAIIIANTGRIDWSSNSTTGTNLGDTSIGRAAAGVLKISLGAVSTTTGGSLSFPSTTTAIAANTNDLALTASAFQRLNCTAASSLTGIAPPSGGTHVDGRMIRVYNVGTANLTLTHNSGLSTTANRYWNSTAADIVLATNDYAELIYDSTSNGSGISGWRVS